jgi:hypothetical protein
MKKQCSNRREYQRKYRLKNREALNAYQRKWLKLKRVNEPKFRIDHNLGTAMWKSLKEKKAGLKWEKLIGYTADDLMKHLEKLFNDKMNWGNYGSYWAIDHRKPVTLFKYETVDDVGFKECWSLINLQPLEKLENIRKNNHYGR